MADLTLYSILACAGALLMTRTADADRGKVQAPFNAAAGLAIEPSVGWVDGGAPAVGSVGIDPASTATQVELVAVSASGTWFCVKDVSTSGTKYGKGATEAAAVTACTAAKW